MGTSRPWTELAVALSALTAVLVALAVTDTVAAPEAWTLVAMLAAGYMLSRGFARTSWASARRSVAAPARSPVTAAPAGPAPAPLDTGDGEFVLSEERLHVGTRVRRERVRLHKHVVTEWVTITVPIRREEFRIERVPIDGREDDGVGDPERGVELVLSDEEPVVEKRVVPRERVWLEREVVTEQRSIQDSVRREEIEVERYDEEQQA